MKHYKPLCPASTPIGGEGEARSAAAGRVVFVGADVYDGTAIRRGAALVVDAGAVAGVAPSDPPPEGGEVIELDGGLIAPGYVDLQVYGGDGATFNADPSVATLTTIAEAQARRGATSILPTFITDTPEATEAAIRAAEQAAAGRLPGVEGLHLEGPHIAAERRGGHDPAHIRPMAQKDLDRICDAAQRLPALMVTVAPEAVSLDQIGAMRAAGVVVSLGHSNATAAEARAAAEAGAVSVTHIFNAMRPIAAEEPGLAGAALTDGRLFAGLLADASYIHLDVAALALAAKRGPAKAYLVSHATASTGMASAGRSAAILDDALSLTKRGPAGSEMSLTAAIRAIAALGRPLAEALAMTTATPARLIGRRRRIGALATGRPADFVYLDSSLALAGVWRKGAPIQI